MSLCKFIFCSAFLFVSVSAAQNVPNSEAAATSTPSNDAIRSQLVTLLNDFIATVKTAGFNPSLPAPTIVLDNPPSYGRYEDDKNLLHISVWSALSPEQQARFSRLASLLGEGKTAEQTFEDGVHHWVFIHELSHWWQACQHKTGENHYSVEYGANRIAAAYWRLKDPDFMARTEKKMAMVSASMTNPVPPGESEEKYFNEN